MERLRHSSTSGFVVLRNGAKLQTNLLGDHFLPSVKKAIRPRPLFCRSPGPTRIKLLGSDNRGWYEYYKGRYEKTGDQAAADLACAHLACALRDESV